MFFFAAAAEKELIMKSRDAAQEEESGRKGMLGESTSLLLQLECSHSPTFRCGALLMYEADERVQQLRLTQRDLIVPHSADLQSRMTVNTHAPKLKSQVQTCARAMGAVNQDQCVATSLTAVFYVFTMPENKSLSFSIL